MVDPTNFSHLESIMHYQSATLVFAGVAFVGAYLALFRRLLDQLNNNDIYPISFHYYSAWLRFDDDCLCFSTRREHIWFQ